LFEFGVGIGSYRMMKVKDFQNYTYNSLRYNIPVDFLISGNFSPYIDYRLNLMMYNKNKLKIGIGYGFYTTGSRIVYSDYSGLYSLDLITNGHALRAPIRWSLLPPGKIDLYFYSDFELVSSSLKLKQNFTLNQSQFIEDTEIHAFGFNLQAEPGIGIDYYFGKLAVGASVGISMGKGEDLHEKGNNKNKIVYQNSNYINLDWSGVRCCLLLKYKFHFFVFSEEYVKNTIFN